VQYKLMTGLDGNMQTRFKVSFDTWGNADAESCKLEQAGG